jgi:hypothetical protein
MLVGIKMRTIIEERKTEQRMRRNTVLKSLMALVQETYQEEKPGFTSNLIK